ncbi:MAG TPA: 50S ribosomal protein L10 [Candidatus Limnocylindrales bacterium]|jgi:large subunit ribosomal protein L10|nr:50S ribosomal protein L10 [Candidatus Limnocylindrales bacterium]
MPTEAKRATVAALAEAFAANQAAIVTDYRGLTVAEIGAVRRTLRAQGIRYQVVKNRLARIAAQQAGLGEIEPLLEGPTAICQGPDEVSLAHALVEAIRPYKAVTVRGALVHGRRLDAEAVTTLASLPGREVLLAQLAGAMASPLATMVGLIRAPIQNLGGGLAQLAEQRGQAAS